MSRESATMPFRAISMHENRGALPLRVSRRPPQPVSRRPWPTAASHPCPGIARRPPQPVSRRPWPTAASHPCPGIARRPPQPVSRRPWPTAASHPCPGVARRPPQPVSRRPWAAAASQLCPLALRTGLPAALPIGFPIALARWLHPAASAIPRRNRIARYPLSTDVNYRRSLHRVLCRERRRRQPPKVSGPLAAPCPNGDFRGNAPLQRVPPAPTALGVSPAGATRPHGRPQPRCRIPCAVASNPLQSWPWHSSRPFANPVTVRLPWPLRCPPDI
jgi:hypothetical protein